MPKLSANKLDLNKKWWHRLITVLFVIITIAWIAIAVSISDWYSWLQTFFNIFIGIVIWLTITNLIYHEWLIYIVTGEHWNSLYRKIHWYYNRIPVDKRKKIIISTIFIVIWLFLLKFVLFPVISNKLTNIWNSLLDDAQKMERRWIEVNYTWTIKKVSTYCRIAFALNKSSKNLKCMWRIAKDSYKSQDFFLQALNFSPTIEEEIKIRSDLVRSYLFDNNDVYQAQQQIDILFDTNGLKNDLRNYPDVLCTLYVYLWYMTIQEGTLSEALDMINMAWEYANEDWLKFGVWIARSDMYATKLDYLTALSIITSMQEDENWYRLTDTNKKTLKEIESKLRKEWNLYGVYNDVQTSSASVSVETPNMGQNTSYVTSNEPQNDLEYCQQKWWDLFISRWRSPNWTVTCWCKEGYSRRVAWPGVVCEPFAQESRTCAMSYGDNSKYDGSKCICKDWFTMSPDWTYCQWPWWETLLEYCQKTYWPNSAPRENDKSCY